MEDIKDEENSDSSFTFSDFDSESDKEESLQEEQYHIESSGSDLIQIIYIYIYRTFFLLINKKIFFNF